MEVGNDYSDKVLTRLKRQWSPDSGKGKPFTYFLCNF